MEQTSDRHHDADASVVSPHKSATWNLTARYLLALGTIAALALGNYLILRAEIRTDASAVAILNVSEQQRMFLQHAALLAQELATTHDASRRQGLRQDLLETVTRLETTHYRLIEFDAPRDRNQRAKNLEGQSEEDVEAASRVARIYFGAPWLLDTEVRNYIAQIKAIAHSEPGELTLDNPHLRYIRDVALSNRVMDALDEVVSAYQQQIESKTGNLRRLAFWSFLSTYGVLGLTGLFVFRPMVRRVRHDLLALEHLNDTLEQRVGERTALAEQRASELEQSESALRNQTRILQAILDSMGEAVVVADRESQFLMLNPAARRVFNISRQDVRPELWNEYWSAERFGVRLFLSDQTTPYPQRDFPLISAMRGEAVDRAEAYLQRDGEPKEVWLSASARPVVDDDGIVHGGVAVFRDITEWKRAELELKNSEALYHSLVDNLPVCVLRKDLQGHFLFANDLLCKLLGCDMSGVIGKSDCDFYPKPLAEKYRRDDREVIATGTVLEAIEEHVTPDGKRMDVEVRKAPVFDSAGEIVGTQLIFWDVTPRILAQREREDMQEKLLQSERLAAIGQMVAGVAHESRNALQQIQACTQLLRWRDDQNGHAEVRALAADIQQAIDRLHLLFDDLRSYAAPVRLDRRTSDVRSIVHDAWKRVVASSDGTICSLSDEESDTQTQCKVDPFQMEQVFRNILENALDACPQSIEVEVQYSNTATNGNPALCVAIRDNGPGLSDDAKSHAFDPFFTTKTHGTGLGMAIAKRIVEAHGGHIGIGHGHLYGAEIVVTLPRELS